MNMVQYIDFVFNDHPVLPPQGCGLRFSLTPFLGFESVATCLISVRTTPGSFSCWVTLHVLNYFLKIDSSKQLG